jgi:hypothetical protein
MCLTNRKARRHGRRVFGALAKGVVVFAALKCFAYLGAPSGWAVDDTKPIHWQQMYDFDGDGKNDEIKVEFTGGAHCCYRLTVWLSLTRKAYRLPVFLDGGYVGGLDPLSKPDHFNIRKTDGALPELLMRINTYNGEPYTLPNIWKRRFRLKTNFVAVGFARGRLRVRDWPPQSSSLRPHSITGG